MKISKFDIQSCRENVLQLVDCNTDSDLYEEVCEEYEELLKKAYEKIEPVALLEFGPISGLDMPEKIEAEALYCITSIGNKMSQWATQFFNEGDYLKGMLADAIADDYLFQMEHLIGPTMIELCKEKHLGVVRRLEAPQDVPMEAQKVAWEITKAKENAGIGITQGFMYDPVKTTCQIFVLRKGYEHYAIEHDCSRCPNINCKLRSIPTYKIHIKSVEEQVIIGKKDRSLMENLQENKVYFNSVCGGKGSCGKCKVRVLKGTVGVSKEDKKFFTDEELNEGYRLACKAYPETDCEIQIKEAQEENFEVVSDYGNTQKKRNFTKDGKYGIAVDIGTTTIAMQLLDLKQGDVLDTYSTINKQRSYGADVISRIEASNHGKKEILKELIRNELLQGVDELTKQGEQKITKMVIGANTTMVHLLMGYSCETLGVYPFKPINIQTIHTDSCELLGKETDKFPIVIYPGASTYVGGDITAGMYALDFDKKEKISMLIDLGTNGEMAIGNKEKILVASTAAGPAFEGGNITHGVGSIPGAICGVDLKDNTINIRTIGEKQPIGICGTGVIDITSGLVEEELIDETGLLEEEYFESGFPIAKDREEKDIVFTQKDVREIQLAKSAVRAGIETLILQYGVSYKEIDTIYIAGGFGYKMNIKKAISIGLFPKECEEKLKAVGNTCLQGTYKYLMDQAALERTEYIIEHSKEVHLSNDKNFNEFYMDYMYFE